MEQRLSEIHGMRDNRRRMGGCETVAGVIRREYGLSQSVVWNVQMMMREDRRLKRQARFSPTPGGISPRST
jgi:hypothetical protein